MTTNQQTALRLTARQLVRAQEIAFTLGKRLAADLTELHTQLNHLGRSLEAAGATAPTEDYQGAAPPAPDSLAALRRIESSRPQAEALLAGLESLLPLAEALDRARGDWVGDMADTEHGETPGTNYAEAIQELLLGLRREVHGAKGSGRE